MATYPTVRNGIAFDANFLSGDYDLAARLHSLIGAEKTIEEVARAPMAEMVRVLKQCKTQQSLDLVRAGAQKARVTLAPK